MLVQVDTGSLVPPYEQVRAQIVDMIDGGVLGPGSRLPTIRQLANDLGLATGTIARAYRELETGGYVTGRGRHGTFITDSQTRAPHRERRQRLTDAAARFAAEAHRLGIEPEVALASARAALARPH